MPKHGIDLGISQEVSKPYAFECAGCKWIVCSANAGYTLLRSINIMEVVISFNDNLSGTPHIKINGKSISMLHDIHFD